MRFRNFICLLIALCAATLFSVACGSRAESKNKESASASPTPAAVQVTTAAAISRQMPRYTEATGALAADEQTDVAPNIGGRVASVNVDLGTFVQKGAVLVKLDDRDARLRLEQAQAQLDQAEASVKQAEERLGLRPGQKFDVTRVAEVGAAKAALDLAEKQLKRDEKLIESGDISRATYDQQKAQRDQLQQQYESALAQARQSYAAIATARAAADAARAQVAQAQKAIADTVIYSPIAGYVSDRPADVGEYVSTSSKIATVMRTNPLRLRIDIPEQAIPNIRVGETVSITTSAYPDRTFNGHIARISPNVTATSRTLTVEAEVENGENLLKPGQFATARILLPQSAPATLVPQRAVKTANDANYVYVIKDGRAQERVVQLGDKDGDLIEIKNGVAPDEIVATSNVDQLKDGMAVIQ
jgi:multidrug efflux pump subunit AcrA (membrane-fusion protein)